MVHEPTNSNTKHTVISKKYLNCYDSFSIQIWRHFEWFRNERQIQRGWINRNIIKKCLTLSICSSRTINRLQLNLAPLAILFFLQDAKLKQRAKELTKSSHFSSESFTMNRFWNSDRQMNELILKCRYIRECDGNQKESKAAVRDP